MSNPFLGEIRMFGGSFAPAGWAMCNGQLMDIAQNDALFSLLGTSYGGDGISNFGLPNLQGRLAVCQGNGQGLAPHTIGETAGTETVTLTTNQIPQHNHAFQASTITATTTVPGATVLPAPPSIPAGHFFVINDNTTPAPTMDALEAAACGTAGGSQPHDNLMPTLCVTFIIALNGIYPSRN